MQQPNIVFITTDQMRDDSYRLGGNDIIQTVAIDHLARRGIRFTKAFSQQPVCIPARASILTGMEGNELGITDYVEGYELPTNETLPQLLKNAGYQTKLVGKMHQYPERCHYGFESMLICEEGRKIGQANGQFRGYDDYEIWLAEQGYAGQAFTHGMSNNDHSVTTWHLPDDLHPTEWIGNETCKAIKNRDWTRPLFLWSSFTAPHPPLVPLAKDLAILDSEDIDLPVLGDWMDNQPYFHELNQATFHGNEKSVTEIKLARKAYYALIMQVDRQINKIIGTLREEGMLENTWFVFTSDHGDNLGDHLLWGKRNFLRGSTQIPFIITPPIRGELDEIVGKDWLPGEKSSVPVGLHDILPTCLDIANIKIPSHISGRSLLPFVCNQESNFGRVIFGELGNCGERTFMLTDGKWKYIWYEHDGKELLFDLVQDSYEINNLVHINKEISERFRKKFVEILAKRKNDPAIKDNQLTSVCDDIKLDKRTKRYLATDHNVRGLH